MSQERKMIILELETSCSDFETSAYPIKFYCFHIEVIIMLMITMVMATVMIKLAFTWLLLYDVIVLNSVHALITMM